MRAFNTTFFKSQSRKLLVLGVPLTAYSLVFSTLVVIDIYFASKYSVVALAAVGIGASLDLLLRGFTIGVVHISRSYMGQAWGARNRTGIGHLSRQSLWLGQMLSWATVLLYWLAIRNVIPMLNIDPAMVPVVLQYTDASVWAIPALTAFYSLRYLMEVAGHPSLTLNSVIIGAGFNIVADWALMFGHLGLPELGVFGCGLATTLVYWGLLVTQVMLIYRHASIKEKTRLFDRWEWPDAATIKNMLRVGTPVGITFFFTEGFLTAVAFMAAVVSTQLAASYALMYAIHTIYMRAVAGLSGASNVLVSRSIGGRKSDHARIRFAYIFSFAVLFCGALCLLLFLFRAPIVHFFGDNPNVQAEVIAGFWLFALFEFINGLRIMLIDALRSYKDTRVTLFANMFSSYGVGVPLIAVLLFNYNFGFNGLMLGFIAMMAVYLITLSLRYRRVAYK